MIRPADGYEFCVTFSCLSLSDEYDVAIDVEDFKERLRPELAKYDVFNLSLKYDEHGEHPVWVRHPADVDALVVVSPWADRADVEPCAPLMPSRKDGTDFLYRIHVSTAEGRSRVTLYALHALCDGRTIWNMFAVVRNAVRGEKRVEFANHGLPAFGQAANYTIESSAYDTRPKSWGAALPGALFPKVAQHMSRYLNRYVSYPYGPIRDYCRRNGVSVQGLMTAMRTRSSRRYNRLGDDVPISVYMPTDTRAAKYATEAFRRRSFFCVSGANFPSVVGQGSLEGDIRHCSERVREAVETPDPAFQVVLTARCVDPVSLDFTPLKGIPDHGTHHLVVASHIGYYDCHSPRLGLHCVVPPENDDSYVISFDGYHNDETMYFMVLYPDTVDPHLIETLLESIDETVKFVSSN